HRSEVRAKRVDPLLQESGIVPQSLGPGMLQDAQQFEKLAVRKLLRIRRDVLVGTDRSRDQQVPGNRLPCLLQTQRELVRDDGAETMAVKDDGLVQIVRHRL